MPLVSELIFDSVENCERDLLRRNHRKGAGDIITGRSKSLGDDSASHEEIPVGTLNASSLDRIVDRPVDIALNVIPGSTDAIDFLQSFDQQIAMYRTFEIDGFCHLGREVLQETPIEQDLSLS